LRGFPSVSPWEAREVKEMDAGQCSVTGGQQASDRWTVAIAIASHISIEKRREKRALIPAVLAKLRETAMTDQQAPMTYRESE